MFRAEVNGNRYPRPEEEIIWVKMPEAVGKFWYEEDNAFFNQIKDTL